MIFSVKVPTKFKDPKIQSFVFVKIGVKFFKALESLLCTQFNSKILK